jgi:hypothetical protein
MLCSMYLFMIDFGGGSSRAQLHLSVRLSCTYQLLNYLKKELNESFLFTM